MKHSFVSHIKHPVFLSGVAVVAVIGVASAAYYVSAQRPAQYKYVAAQAGTVTETVTETGTVKAASEVDLGFQASGQIAHVYADAGTAVSVGQSLASLSNGDAYAQLALAQANLQAAQAKLDSLQHGTRPEQLAINQTAVDQASLALSNSYSGAASSLQNGYISANDAVRKQLNSFFNNPEQLNASLSFNTVDSQGKVDAENGRVAMSVELDAWQKSILALSPQSDPKALDLAIADAAAHLANVQRFLGIVNSALTHELSISAASLPAYQASLTAAQSEVSASLSAVVGLKQLLAAEAAAVTQAQNNLNLAKAGATADDIAAQSAAVAAAQAAVSNAGVQLEKTIIRAPIAGTVSKSGAKIGMNVSPNVPVISLVSGGKFQVETYLAEDDVSRVKAGDQATVTLDAYGSGVSFPASVISVDSAQTLIKGFPSYKAVLEFSNDDARLRADLTANVSIVSAVHPNAVEIPASAVIRRGADTFVLLDSGTTKPAERQVQAGIRGTDGTTEILSGLSAGDRVVDFGGASL